MDGFWILATGEIVIGTLLISQIGLYLLAVWLDRREKGQSR